ncbi:hypothetical protein LIER_13828 [Lithospermum erythrorhizon]|uniref:Uncharacterized protein n=1 Tax=Lithospermum erythrorhizon TaxID=34254 RepID=A0AAV3PZC2_LITER
MSSQPAGNRCLYSAAKAGSVGPISPGEQCERLGTHHPSPPRPSLGPEPTRQVPRGGEWPRMLEDADLKVLSPKPPP